jgi:hypothetical protein
MNQALALFLCRFSSLITCSRFSHQAQNVLLSRTPSLAHDLLVRFTTGVSQHDDLFSGHPLCQGSTCPCLPVPESPPPEAPPSQSRPGLATARIVRKRRQQKAGEGQGKNQVEKTFILS